MEPKNNKIIKGIRLYLLINGIFLVFVVVVGFGVTILSFIKSGSLTNDHFSSSKIKLIIPPKEIIISPFLDGLAAILIGLVIACSIIAIIYFLLKFSNNLIASQILCKENGKYLRLCGWILSFVTALYQTRDFLFNLNNNNAIANSSTVINILLVLIQLAFSAVMHPLFWLGMFAVLFGKILEMASEVKQENDLTI